MALRQRLIVTGDLDPTAGDSPVFDSYVEAGVRRFQARHGLSATGVVSAATLAAMNVPVDVRLRSSSSTSSACAPFAAISATATS